VSVHLFESKRGPPSGIALLVLMAAYVLVRSVYWNCAPIWDGMADFADLFLAKERPFDVLNYGIDGHNCQGFLWVMALPYQLFKRDFYLFNIWLTLFGLVSLATFYNLLAFFFNGQLGRWEMALITALFVFHPSVLSSMIHFCLDMGVVTFFLLYWLFLLKERWIAATLFACLLMFTKETALLLLPVPFLFCLLRQAPSQRRPWARRYFFVLAVPYLLFEAFLLYKTQIRQVPPLWNFYIYKGGGPWAILVNYFGESRSLANYLGMIFLMNFNWLLCLVWGGLLVAVLRRSGRVADQGRPGWKPGEPAGKMPALLGQPLGVGLLLVFLATGFVLTLVRPYYDVRYIMLLIPLMLLSIAQLSCRLAASSAARMAVALVFLALFAGQDLRTMDPVSKAFFGTFDFGKHPMLNMNHRPGEVASSGPDRLVYNLEFLKFRQLLAQILADIRPTPQTYILSHPLTSWRTFTLLDSHFKPTFELDDAFSPRYGSAEDVLKLPRLPDDVYFLDLPNYDNQNGLAMLKDRYPKKATRVYDLSGYQITVVHFSRIGKG
jgi:hypothetical protein